MGGANVFGSFIDCFPCAASLSRSSVQEKAGGKTQLTTIFSSMFLFFTILFAGPLFFYLPKVRSFFISCFLTNIALIRMSIPCVQFHHLLSFDLDILITLFDSSFNWV